MTVKIPVVTKRRNKSGDLDKIEDGNIDILCIAETKLDKSFPNNQLILEGYHLPHSLDITDKKRWLDDIF